MPSPTDERPAPDSPPIAPTLRSARLRQSARFQAIRSQGRWWSHRLMTVGVLSNGQAASRCGFSVGKRLGNAVVRNRARRRMREALRLVWPQIAPGFDIVFAAREPLRSATFADIQEAVGTLLQRARLLRPQE